MTNEQLMGRLRLEVRHKSLALMTLIRGMKMMQNRGELNKWDLERLRQAESAMDRFRVDDDSLRNKIPTKSDGKED